MPLVWVGARRETRFGAEYLRKGTGTGACLGLPGAAGACQTAGMSDGFDGERIAEERIAEAARTGQDWLNLGNLGLTRLPEGLFRLTRLRRLNWKISRGNAIRFGSSDSSGSALPATNSPPLRMPANCV